MSRPTHDQCYAGLSADGKMILKPKFAASMLRCDAQAQDGAAITRCGISRAFDAKPVETHVRIVDLMEDFLEDLAEYYESDELDPDVHNRLIARLRSALSTLELTEKTRNSAANLERSQLAQAEKDREEAHRFMANDSKVSPLRDRIAAVRARRAQRALDSQIEKHQPGYSSLQAAFDAARNQRVASPKILTIDGAAPVTMDADNSPVKTPAQPVRCPAAQAKDRAIFRNHNVSNYSQSDQTVDSYIDLQRAMDSQRGKLA